MDSPSIDACKSTITEWWSSLCLWLTHHHVYTRESQGLALTLRLAMLENFLICTGSGNAHRVLAMLQVFVG